MILFSVPLSAQTDTISKKGTIKIVKKADSTYIKATLEFYDFSEESTPPQAKKMSYSDFVKEVQKNKKNEMPVLVPHPKTKDEKKIMDYTAYFKNHPETRALALPDDVDSDTVRIAVYVNKKGVVRFSDLSPSKQLGKIVATYDTVSKNYKVDIIHFRVNNAFRTLAKSNWEPAYLLKPQRGQFKKVTVIKPEKVKVNASGLLVVIISKKRLTAQEWK
jgi:hypothetical protein